MNQHILLVQQKSYLKEPCQVRKHIQTDKNKRLKTLKASQLSNIILACSEDQPMDIRSKSLSSLQLLTRKGS